MRISTKGRYAIRLMLDLAANAAGEPIRLKDTAKRQNISEKYLEQIISVLNKAGYVKSTRGPQGGYLPACSPSEITVGEILRVMEGNLAPVDCILEDHPACGREAHCASRILWRKVDQAVGEVVDHVTLQDLLSWETAEK